MTNLRAPPGLESHSWSELLVVTRNRALQQELARQGYTFSTVGFNELHKLHSIPNGTLLGIDVASRTAFQQGGLAHACRQLAEAQATAHARGLPTVLIARKHGHSDAWKSCLRKLQLYETQHCLCHYKQNARHVHFRVFTSGLACRHQQCRLPDVALSLSRQELDSTSAAFVPQWCARWLAVEDEPLEGGQVTNPSGSQQSPDSARCSIAQSADATATEKPVEAVSFPTDAKERERARRKAQKEAGQEHVVQHRTQHVEEHYDDCGEDLSSLGCKDAATELLTWTTPGGVPEECPETDLNTDPAVAGMSSFMLYGARRSLDMSHLQTVHLSTLDEFEHVYTSSTSKVPTTSLISFVGMPIRYGTGACR